MKSLWRLAPGGHARRPVVHELDRQPDELVREHPAADEARASRGCSRRPRCRRRGRRRRRRPARRSRPRPCTCGPSGCGPPSRGGCRGRSGAAGSSRAAAVAPTRWRPPRRPRRPPAAPAAGRSRRSRRRRVAPPAVVEQDLLHLALGAQPRVAGGERARDHGVVRAVLRVRLAAEADAPADPHAGRAAVVGHAVDERAACRTGAGRAAAPPATSSPVLARTSATSAASAAASAAGP